ncbi:MAG TPA: lysylphosphatidylglycerol synthase transmembrane domain-containing protein [Candidatus Pacearchaeota archaeon]|nr:lysylphosphatidylglycerol synthase transmembrane domain-containing protein [Candidatus Pacearchaeota archaeon]
MKNQLILIILSFIIGIIAFIFLGKWIGWEEIGKAFSVFTGIQGAVILFITLIIALLGNWGWREILKDQGIDIPFLNLFKIYLGGYSIMYLFPSILLAGEFFRMYGLGKERGLSWKRTAPSVIIERVLEWTSNLLVVFLGLFLFVFKINFFSKKIILFFGAAFCFFLFAIIFFYTVALRKRSIVHLIVKKYKEEQESGLIEVENQVFNYFDLKSRYLIKGLALSFLRALVMQLRVWILILFLGENIGFLHSFLILGFSYLSSMIPIPTSLGTHEAIQIGAFRSIGLPVSMAAAFTLIIRAAEIVISLFGLVYIIRMGFNLKNNIYENKQDS